MYGKFARRLPKLFARLAAATAAFSLLVGIGFADGLHLPPVPPAVNAPQFDFDGEIKTDVANILDWDQGAAGTGPGVIEATRNNVTGVCTQTNLPATAGGPGVVGSGLLICDPAQNVGTGDTGFVQGSKNEGTHWVIQPTGQPKKADLAEVMLYAKFGDSTADADSDPDDLFVFAGATRLDTNGDTHIDIELNRNNPLAGCTTSGTTIDCPNGAARVNGDVLIAIDLAQGGVVPTERIFRFQTTLSAGQTCANAPQVSPPCLVEITAANAAIGLTNPVEISAAVWRAVGCDPTSGDPSSGCKLRDQIPPRGFMEAFIDLTAFGIEAGCPGFSNVLFKTRSADALNSALQDFAQGQIDVTRCGSIAWEKRDDLNALQGGATFTVGGASGPFACLGDNTNPVTVIDNGTNDADPDAGQLLLDNVCAGTYTITETIAPTGFALDDDTTRLVTVVAGQAAVVGTQGQDDPGDTDESDFHNRLGTLIIHKNDDQGNPLGGATFSISPNAASCYGGTLTSVTDNGLNDANPAAGVIQVNRVCLNATGYTVTETQAPPGFALADPASQGPFPLLETTPSLTITFTFQNRLGSLAWEKRDDLGVLQGGATFSISPNPFACHIPPGSLTSVTDNDVNDADSDPGQIQLNRVCLGSYTVTETAAPVGFAIDVDDTRAQDVSLANLNAVIGMQGVDDPGVTDESDFHNRLGSLAWEKRDDLGALQGGATFSISPNPFACHTPPGSLTSVTDNDVNDADSDPGQIQLNRVCLGSYTITETAAPGGFAKDADDTRDQTVSAADLNAVVGTQGQDDAGVTDESDFHNRLGSITINKNDKLTNAPVTVGGATFEIAPNPHACHGGVGTFTVVDDADGITGPGDVDQNPAAGVVQVNRACLLEAPAGYTVTETVPPMGFSLPIPATQGPTPLTGAVNITFTFTDLPLLKLRVQVQRMSDDSVVSGVVLDLNSLSMSCGFLGADTQTQPTGAGAGGTGQWTELNLNCLVNSPGYEVKITTPDP